MGMLGRRVLALLVAALAMTVVAACGSDDDDGGGGGGGGSGREGGSITISQTSQPDFLDPALSYTVNGWEPMWLVYTPPVTYAHEEGAAGAELIPGIAEEMPTVSEDGLTYSFKIRDGLKFSNGKPVKPSDWEHTIKRVLNLESGGASFFEVIEGAAEYVKAGKAEADISGIEANDETGEVTITLTGPDGSFMNVLGMNFAGVVPGDTPFDNQTKTPPPGVGPYEITESVPNRQFVMERVKGFDIPGIPPGKVDKITTKIIKSASRQAQDVIRGDLDYMQDPPPADLKPEIKAKYKDRYEEFTTVSTYYFFMNHKAPPFDDPKVRQAVNYGVDKPAIARLFAGELQPGCSFFPPGLPGYDESLDQNCPWGDPNEPPDLEKARALIEEAGVAGDQVTVYGNNDDPTPRVTQAYADMLEDIGFETEVKILDGGVYFQTIGNQKEQAQTGFNNWFQDFPHPANFTFLVDGDSIQPTNNRNEANIDVPEINDTLDELRKEPELTDEVAERYGEVNKTIVEDAHMVPYGYRKLATFMSERMDFENCSLFHPVYQNDYSSFCLK
jgi:peptide/nickel transport system substrate-binding protein